MDRARILVVGAGQLGSRYLQGLATLDQDLEVYAVDPNIHSLSIARERVEDTKRNNNHNFYFLESLPESSTNIDVAVIATTASYRAKAVIETSQKLHIRNWILEKVLAQSVSQLDLIRSSIPYSSPAYVNTPRRLMQWHKEIKKKMFEKLNGPINVEVTGSDLAIACNAIHYIDLICWWLDIRLVDVDTSKLSSWVSAKRQGYMEVMGTLKMTFSDNSVINLTRTENESISNFRVETSTEEWIIDEFLGIATSSSNHEITGELSLQSKLTPLLFHQLLATGTCLLPTLDESLSQHRPLLESLIDHWNQKTMNHDTIVPIT